MPEEYFFYNATGILLQRSAGAHMRWKGWEKVPLTIPDPADSGKTLTVQAIAPLIISASRSTDIPAFYGDWFMARLGAGYVRWKSPFGSNPLWVSFEKTRVFVFWSKNPAPFLSHLDSLDRRGYYYYFLFTLNDYDAEGLEPGVPPLGERIDTFIRLSRRVGKGRVVWRFDPLVLSDRITVRGLLEKIQRIGDRISPFTRRMVFSFVDIEKYGKVRRNLQAAGVSGAREFTEGEVEEFCSDLAALNRRWGLSVTACAEGRDLSRFGIGRGQCISGDLMAKEFGSDRILMDFLQPDGQQTLGSTPSAASSSRRLKDPGQRNTCRCIVSKDIGQYSTCPHLCSYCYANTSQQSARRNYARYLADRDREIFHDTITV
jgi:DNA repair photolyase